MPFAIVLQFAVEELGAAFSGIVIKTTVNAKYTKNLSISVITKKNKMIINKNNGLDQVYNKRMKKKLKKKKLNAGTEIGKLREKRKERVKFEAH